MFVKNNIMKKTQKELIDQFENPSDFLSKLQAANILTFQEQKAPFKSFDHQFACTSIAHHFAILSNEILLLDTPTIVTKKNISNSAGQIVIMLDAIASSFDLDLKDCISTKFNLKAGELKSKFMIIFD